MKEGVLTSVRQVRLVNEPERKTLTKSVSVGWGQLLQEARERVRGETVESIDQSSQELCCKAEERKERQRKGDVESRGRCEGVVTGPCFLLMV